MLISPPKRTSSFKIAVTLAKSIPVVVVEAGISKSPFFDFTPSLLLVELNTSVIVSGYFV